MEFAPVLPVAERETSTVVGFAKGLTLPEREIKILSVRELTQEEINKDSRVVYDLEKVRRGHQAIARYLAMGLRPYQVAELTGYNVGTIYQLQTSPLMQALIDEFSAEIDTQATDLREVMLNIAGDGLAKLREHINSEQADADFIRQTTFGLLSRVGFGETNKTENKHLHAHLSREEIAEIKSKIQGNHDP